MFYKTFYLYRENCSQWQYSLEIHTLGSVFGWSYR